MPTFNRRAPGRSRVIYDVLYGFIPITEWEEKIMNSPFFQRLRWIKQLGFANYIFPGAEHNRFAHVIGVMHTMDQMIRALGMAASDDDLFDPKARSQSVMLHKSLRIAALLHDIGTFPFSHSIENAYLRHGVDERRPERKSKDLPNNHEHLGSFIIKNTDYDGGLTRILEQYGFDVQLLSKIIKGDSPHLIANQLMHSDLDADRMDYLIRDSHYTGIKYGQFDRDYIVANLTPYEADGEVGFGVSENAVHAVEDFLIARFSWYSQILKNQGSAKFDIIAAHIAQGLLEHDLIYQFQDLLTMVSERDERFFWWTDMYFMTRCLDVKMRGLIKDPRLLELLDMLLYRKAPKTLNHPLFAHKILSIDGDGSQKKKLLKQIQNKIQEFEKLIQKHNAHPEQAWILADIPATDVVFTRKSSGTKKQERDPVKIVSRNGQPRLLVERDNSLMKRLSGLANFVPSVYANDQAYETLRAHRQLHY